MTRSIQSILAGARLENEFNGLPCGDYVYTNKCADQEAYRALDAIPSPEQIAAKKAKKEAENAARILEARTLNTKELTLAIQLLDEARRHSLMNTSNDLHWDIIPILFKLRRMLDDNHTN
jgi:hypothetical protein